MFGTSRGLFIAISCLVIAAPSIAQQTDPTTTIRPSQKTALDTVTRLEEELKQINHAIWEFAEIGLQERQSSELLVTKLRSEGFEIRSGVSGMPTAFVASYGTGHPIIGILAEYDALPGMSQEMAAERRPIAEGGAGHACGHSGLGTAALGAAIAIKEAIAKHQIPGTIRLYGTPAEETVIGKVYMTLDGQFDDLDVCLHWHPSDKNGVWSAGSKALVSAKFTFKGTASHASVSPDAGRSALDGVELMNVGANYMREHVKEDARIHYVIVNGGGQPNVVPPEATVWYFVRSNSHGDVEYLFKWLQEIADGAAKMSRTTYAMQIDTDCHEIIPNDALSTLLVESMRKVGAPKFTDQEVLFARRLQQPLSEQFALQFPLALDDEIHATETGADISRGSTDVGDISWRVPTGGLRTTCFIAGSPGHSWQNVACIGSTIGEKGFLFAARTLSITAIDLLEKPELVRAAREDWQARMKDRKYSTLIPEGQKAPAAIR
jgi:aminobenzoyl-glutamate utilization protein B